MLRRRPWVITLVYGSASPHPGSRFISAGQHPPFGNREWGRNRAGLRWKEPLGPSGDCPVLRVLLFSLWGSPVRVLLGALGPAFGVPFLLCPGLTRCQGWTGTWGRDRHRPLLLLWFALVSALCSAHPWTEPVLAVQPAKDEGRNGPSGDSRCVSGTCSLSEESVPSFVPELSRSSDSRPKVDKQVPGGLAASSLFLGGEARKGTAEDAGTAPLPSYRNQGSSVRV